MDINSFKANFKYGGTRASNFRITLTNPIDASADDKIQFLASASEIPSSTINPIQVPYMGRTIKVAGKKTYPEWTINIYNDEDFAIRDTLETWANFINSPESNVRAGSASDVSLYKSTGQVEQLSQTNKVLRTYRFNGIFPIQISGMRLDFGDDSIGMFSATFAYDYWDLMPGPTGDGGYL